MNWNNAEDSKPICYKTGDWEGKKSDVVLCVDANKEIHLAHCYEGILDGSYFFDWYDENGFELEVEIVYWTEIELPC